MKNLLLFAALAGFFGVALGAMGAHALKAVFTETQMQTYQTAVHYQLWHALLCGLIAILQRFDPRAGLLIWAGRMCVFGILVFSGSLYLLLASGLRWLGMITPVGGISLMAAWLLLAIYAWRSHNLSNHEQDAYRV